MAIVLGIVLGAFLVGEKIGNREIITDHGWYEVKSAYTLPIMYFFGGVAVVLVALSVFPSLWNKWKKFGIWYFVIATGRPRKLEEFIDLVFSSLQLDWHKYVEIDPELYRPSDILMGYGDPSKAREKLGWEPRVPLAEGLEKTIAYFRKLV